MSDQVRPQQEIELFRAVTIREVEERDMLNGTSDPTLKMKYQLMNRDSTIFDSWCPSKDGKV